MPSLSDKLKELGVKIGTQELPSPRPKPGFAIEQVIEGKFIQTPYGEVFITEQHYPFDYHHGRASLRLDKSLRTVASWTGDSRLADIDQNSFYFLDTETSGLSGGTGTLVFLVGIGHLEEDGFHLTQLFMRDPIEEYAMLSALSVYLHPHQGLVTFNGKAFDVPILNNRYVLNSEPSPFNKNAHIDLLPLARRLWRDRLSSRTLSSLEKHILGISRTMDDVPGWLIPSLYFEYLKSGDARPLIGVFYHNAMDVVSMAALLSHITNFLETPLGGAVEHGVDFISLAKLFEDLGDTDLAANLYSRGASNDVSLPNYNEALQRWSFMEKRRHNYSCAIEIWQKAANLNQIYAHVELAKYYEHHHKDYASALEWTRSALDFIEHDFSSHTTRQQWISQLNHRLSRLLKKSKLS